MEASVQMKFAESLLPRDVCNIELNHDGALISFAVLLPTSSGKGFGSASKNCWTVQVGRSQMSSQWKSGLLSRHSSVGQHPSAKWQINSRISSAYVSQHATCASTAFSKVVSVDHTRQFSSVNSILKAQPHTICTQQFPVSSKTQ